MKAEISAIGHASNHQFAEIQQAIADNCSRDPFSPPYVTYIECLASALPEV